MRSDMPSLREMPESDVVQPNEKCILPCKSDAPTGRSRWLACIHNLPAAAQTLMAMLIVFGLYRLFRQPVSGWARADYTAQSFLLSLLAENALKPAFWGSLLLAGGYAVFNRDLRSWGDLLRGGRMAWVAWTLIGVLVWTGSLYPFNFYFGQGHLVDRGIILLLGLVSLRFPACFPALLYAVVVTYLQWRVPGLSDAEYTNRKMVLDLAWVLCAAGLARPLINRCLPKATYAFTLACISAALIHYWIPGVAKLKVGLDSWDWLLHDDLFNLSASTFVHGWSAFWDEEGLVRLLAFLQPLALPMKVFVLVVELALITAFWNRRWFVLLSAGRVMLHAGIFFFSGDSFWNWIVLQIALTAAFIEWPRRGQGDEKSAPTMGAEMRLFSWQSGAVAAVYLLITANSHMASNLAWFDSQVTERYSVYAVMKGGRRLYVKPDFFEPYDFAFIQSQFHFLLPEKVLTRTFGAIHEARVAQAAREARTVEAVRGLIATHGKVQIDAKRTASFDGFLKRWFAQHRALEGVLPKTLHTLSPPLHAYVLSKETPDHTYQGEHPVERLEIEFERTLFDGERFVEMDHRVVHTVSLNEEDKTPGVTAGGR
ncbi:hypothetical protein SAMN02745166_00521 [Prosthecobacter debontii]|uniref:Vitamin K-dependent gamma-carboxylase n=2 Tax=Prosthecobacter debontii TaxID=48467 RepID=A0A1T4WQK4_9BACT|nr:hypothetical protein SAMN02745166_00521 [Prosthecobacter debontii]